MESNKKLLHVNCDRDVFLSTLNSKAETTESRILIFIDAINEGAGKIIWKNYISGFIEAVKRFPNLGIVFSVRTSYLDLLIPKSLKEDNRISYITHHGFTHKEYDASKRFFDNFKIKQPSIPLLHPEFSNPLFLKLFCEGLYKKGLHEIPNGYEGITAILGMYIETINEKLSEKYQLPSRINVIKKIVEKIAFEIAENETIYIDYEITYKVVSEIAKEYNISEINSFFGDIIAEGLITENIYWTEDSEHVVGFYITYERFSDHLVSSYLIENYIDKSNPTESFEVGKRMYKLLENDNTAYFNNGIIQALSIQLPEIIRMELFDVAPHAREFRTVAVAFIEQYSVEKEKYY